MIGRRRPLMRAAMVGGGAYMVGKSAQRKSQQEADQEARLNQLEAQQMQAQAPAPVAAPAPAAAPAGDDLVSKLTELKGLMDAGVLTADEFEAAKQKLLSQ
jgi:putative oligomerization/nucleic acid binding protein